MRFDQLRIGLTVLVSLAIWSLLAWQHFHGGVPAHHLMQNPDLPRVSDWFGGLLPLATFVIHRLISLPLQRLARRRSPA